MTTTRFPLAPSFHTRMPRRAALWAVPMVCVVIGLLMVGLALGATFDAWAGWAPSAFAAAQNIACLIASVVGAIVFAWRGMRHRFEEDRASRHPKLLAPEWKTRSPTLSTWTFFLVGAWGAAFSLIPSTLALLSTLCSFGPQSFAGSHLLLWFTWAMGTSAFISAIALGGALVGALFPSTLAVTFAGLFSYAVAWLPLLVGSETPLAILGGYYDTPWFFYEPGTFTAFLRCGIWISVAVLLPAIGLKSFTWLVVGAVVGGAYLTAGLTSDNTLEPVRHAFETRCTGTSPQLCTPLPFAASLGELDSQIRPGLNLLPADTVPDVVSTHQFVTPDVTDSRLIIDPLDKQALPSNRPTRNETVASLGRSHFIQQCGALDRAAHVNLVGYLSFLSKATDGAISLVSPESLPYAANPEGSSISYAVLTEASLRASLSDAEYTAWLTAHSEEIESCTQS